MGLRYSMKGVQDTLEVFEDRLTITPKGVLGFLNKGLQGTKTIPFSSIKAVQHREAGWIANGFLQFTILGGTENMGGVFSAAKDENSFIFSNSDNNNARVTEIKEFIEQAVDPAGQASAGPVSIGDELVKLASLRAQGILTEEEFQAAKKKILS